MRLINELENTLKQTLGLHKPRINCLLQIVLGVIASRTVNLKRLACVMAGDAEIDSNYRRLQRFFEKVTLPRDLLARMIYRFFFTEEAVYLSMDRTNWKWGVTNLNLLVLSACYKGVAIPLYWSALDKKGNSNTAERIQLIQYFIDEFGRDKIAYLLGDREFVGETWFAYLEEHRVPFDMRVKKNNQTTHIRGLPVGITALFHGLKVDEFLALPEKRELMGQELYLSALRLKDGELLLLASSEAPEGALTRYARRWEIETLFSCLKSKGFHFESTRITKLKRLETLLGVLAIAFAWAHKVGDWRNENHKPIKVKKHGRLSISYFRYGLDWIQQALSAGQSRIAQLEQSITILLESMTRFKTNKETCEILSC